MEIETFVELRCDWREKHAKRLACDTERIILQPKQPLVDVYMETLWRVLCEMMKDSDNGGATDDLKIFLKLSEIQNSTDYVVKEIRQTCFSGLNILSETDSMFG